eukprot:scaffold360_cov192-Amphora_coffeaeformis.AAC.9
MTPICDSFLVWKRMKMDEAKSFTRTKMETSPHASLRGSLPHTPSQLPPTSYIARYLLLQGVVP